MGFPTKIRNSARIILKELCLFSKQFSLGISPLQTKDMTFINILIELFIQDSILIVPWINILQP